MKNTRIHAAIHFAFVELLGTVLLRIDVGKWASTRAWDLGKKKQAHEDCSAFQVTKTMHAAIHFASAESLGTVVQGIDLGLGTWDLGKNKQAPRTSLQSW